MSIVRYNFIQKAVNGLRIVLYMGRYFAHQVLNIVEVRVKFEDPDDARFQKVIGVLNGGWFWIHNENPWIGKKEEIDTVIRSSGSNVNDNPFGVKCLDMPDQLQFFIIIEVGHKEKVLGSFDQFEAIKGSKDDRIFEARDFICYKITQVKVCLFHAQEGVEIGPS